MNIGRMNTRVGLVLALLGISLFGGCSTAPTRDPAFAPVRPTVREAPARTQGAVFVAGYDEVRAYDVALFRDQRARNVGDILTIKLVEQTDATKTAETTVDQATDFTINNPTVLGATPAIKVPGTLPFVDRVLPGPNGKNIYSLDGRLLSDKSFAGTGDSSQSNKLSGEIMVTVAEVLGNGNLVVQGEKIMTLNRGNEHIRFSGIVRPQDVAADNSVTSTRVANPTIVYAGEGEVADASKLGWLARFFVSAFFPL